VSCCLGLGAVLLTFVCVLSVVVGVLVLYKCFCCISDSEMFEVVLSGHESSQTLSGRFRFLI
jgi:hypothetical protein